MTGCVYIMRSSSGGVKIGRSATPKARLKALQSANPSEITLCHLTEERADAAAIERAAHALLAGKRLQGEWFDVSVDEAISAIKSAVESIDAAQAAFISPLPLDPIHLDLAPPRTVRFSQAMMREIEAIREDRTLEQPDFGKVVRELVAAGLEAKGRKRK